MIWCVGLRGHAGALSPVDKRADKRKCRSRDAGVETASLEELPSKEEICRSDQLMEVASCAGVLAATLARF